MKTRLSSDRKFPVLGFTILVVTVISCLTVQYEALAESESLTPGKAVEISSQKALIDNIGTLMEDKLAPLIRMQANLEKLILEDKFSGPKMTDIIGGIGWILGLGGIAAFFWSLKRKPTK